LLSFYKIAPHEKLLPISTPFFLLHDWYLHNKNAPAKQIVADEFWKLTVLLTPLNGPLILAIHGWGNNELPVLH